MGGCAAPNCSNHSKNGFRVFIFPRNPERRAKWLQMCRRNKWQPTPYSALCEAHVEESQFESSRKDGWKTLKPNAVTTIFNVPNRPKPIPPKRRPIIRLPADEEMPPEVSSLAEVEEPSIVDHQSCWAYVMWLRKCVSCREQLETLISFS